MRTSFAFILTLFFAVQAHAQGTNCAAQWNSIVDFLDKAAGAKPPAPGIFRQTADRGCRTDGLTLPAGQRMAIKADILTWKGRDIERFVQEGLPPTGLDLTVSGIRFAPQIGDTTFQYLQDIQARGQNIEVVLSINWSEVTNAISIDNILISLPNDDFIKINGLIEKVDLTSAETLAQSATSFGITELELEIRSERFFQNFLLLPLGMELLDGHADPAARTAELKAIGQKFIEAAPDALLSRGSKAALISLLDDLPDPAGKLTVAQTATPGIGVGRALAFSLRAGSIDKIEDLWPLFEGIETEVTYERF